MSPKADACGIQSRGRNQEESFFARGDAHFARLANLQFIGGQNPENVAANRLLNRWGNAGGPKFLFLGLEIQDFQNGWMRPVFSQATWPIRVERNDRRCPLQQSNWATVANLRGLFLDFWDFRYDYS